MTVTTTDQNFPLYSKSAGPGTISLGGNHAGGNSKANDNYLASVRMPRA